MSNKSYKIGALILLSVVLLGGSFLIWQGVVVKKSPVSEEKALGNSQKASDKLNQLLVRVTEPGEPDDGAIITIGGETHKWGKMEKIKFLIVTVPVLSEAEKDKFMEMEDGRTVYRVAYETFLSAQEIEKIKAQEEGLEKYFFMPKDVIVKR